MRRAVSSCSSTTPELSRTRFAFDLAALRRPFMLWVSDQMAADLTARRGVSRRVPVSRSQKVGAAVSQTLVCEAVPCSFTRVLIKE